jgi:hypothetical protein
MLTAFNAAVDAFLTKLDTPLNPGILVNAPVAVLIELVELLILTVLVVVPENIPVWP